MVAYFHDFEICIQQDRPSESNWEQFIESIFEYDKNFVLEICFDKSEVEFHLHCSKNLSLLTTKTQFILRPDPSRSWAISTAAESFSLLSLPKGKNLLDIKEREELRNNRSLKKVIWSFNSFIKVRSSVLRFYFETSSGGHMVVRKILPGIPIHLLQNIDWASSIRYKKKDAPIYLKIEGAERLFTQSKPDAFLEVDGFPYLMKQNYFPLSSYEFNKHTLIVGHTGVGKSKFITHFIRELEKRHLQNEYAVVLIDPHAAIFPEVGQLSGVANIDFVESACDLFLKNSEPKIATELTIMLFRNLLETQFNAKIEQTLKYTLYVLFSANLMSLFNIKRFLTEYDYRAEVFGIAKTEDSMVHFFDAEFQQIQTEHYESAIMPILTLIDELNFLPVFGSGHEESLTETMQKNFLTCFSISKVFLGEKATKLISGLIIQQIFLIAQSRSLKKKIILIIDEVSSVQNDALVTILAEARKFNLSLFLSIQYLTQVRPELLNGILSNTYNYFVFRTPEEDARILAKNLAINIPDDVIRRHEAQKDTKDDLKVRALTTLDVRNCIVRCYLNGKFYDAFKAIVPQV